MNKNQKTNNSNNNPVIIPRMILLTFIAILNKIIPNVSNILKRIIILTMRM